MISISYIHSHTHSLSHNLSLNYYVRIENKTSFFLYYAFEHAHAPQFTSQQFTESNIRGSFGDSVREMNWAVGKVMTALIDAGVSDNTFVFLTAGNG